MSAADALPMLTAAELARLVAELRRNIARGGYEGQPWSEAFIASAREAYAECKAEVDATTQPTRPVKAAQPVLFVVQNKTRAA